MRTIAVVGASLAGLRSAEALRANGFDGRLVVIGEEVHLPYDRPPLSKDFLLGTVDEDSLTLAAPERYEGIDADWLLGLRAERLDGLPPALVEHAASMGAQIVAVSARLESELASLDSAEAAAMREDLGLAESGLEAVVRGAFSLLELIAFFTAGEDKPAQSWHLRRGLSVWHAAGLIHSDIQKGFVRAEVVSWDALRDAGGYAGARDRGTLRLEGRDYVVADGDVITVKFTP